AVLVGGLETAGAHPDAHVFAELGHPDALLTQVGLEPATHRFGDVTTDTALLLGAPAAMDFVAGANFGSGDLANSGHGWDPLGGSGRSVGRGSSFAPGRNPAGREMSMEIRRGQEEILRRRSRGTFPLRFGPLGYLVRPSAS